MRLAGALLLVCGPAVAQEALYGAQPPAGSAYVRFANATAGPIDISLADLPAVTLGTEEATRVGPYRVVERVAGRRVAVTIRSGPRATAATLALQPDGYATVLLRAMPDGTVLATAEPDGAEFNQARARLSFYNATPACASAGLSLSPAGTAVFSDVVPGGSKSRSVSPVAASVHAACAGMDAADIALSGMEVGGSYSVWLMQPGGTAIAFVTRDATTPYRRS